MLAYRRRSLGGSNLPPVNTILPAVTGLANVGQVLTCSTGSWTGSPSGYAYAWKSNGTPIGGATSSTYTIVSGDDTHTLTCTVTATNASGSTSATSNGIVAVGSTFVSDTFTDTTGTVLTSHTVPTGGPWIIQTDTSFAAGVETISSTGTTYSNNVATLFLSTATPGTADYDVEADLVFKSLPAGEVGTIAGRVLNPTLTYYYVRYNVGTGFQLLSRLAGASGVTLGTYSGFTPGAGSTHHIMLRMRGTTISLLVDGVSRVSVTNSVVTAAGKPGLMHGGTGFTDTTGIHIDNFVATNA